MCLWVTDLNVYASGFLNCLCVWFFGKVYASGSPTVHLNMIRSRRMWGQPASEPIWPADQPQHPVQEPNPWRANPEREVLATGEVLAKAKVRHDEPHRDHGRDGALHPFQELLSTSGVVRCAPLVWASPLGLLQPLPLAQCPLAPPGRRQLCFLPRTWGLPWAEPPLPCGRHSGNIPLALRQLRSLATWPKTPLSHQFLSGWWTEQLARRSIKKKEHVGVRARQCLAVCATAWGCRAAQRWRIGRCSTAIVWVRIRRCSLY